MQFEALFYEIQYGWQCKMATSFIILCELSTFGSELHPRQFSKKDILGFIWKKGPQTDELTSEWPFAPFVILKKKI